MPRLSDHSYLETHNKLHNLWQWHLDTLLKLPREQLRDLLQFFAVREELDDTALLQHRVDVTHKDPGLPQRAGRALRHVDLDVGRPRTQAPVASGRQRQHNISVRGELRDKPDMRRLVRALIEIAKVRVEREQELDRYLDGDSPPDK